MTKLARRHVLQALGALPGTGLVLACAAQEHARPNALVAPSTPPSSSPRMQRPSWTPRFFDRIQAMVVEDVADLLLPETGTPGAKSAGVPQFIESIVEAVATAEERTAFLEGIEPLQEAAEQAHGHPFHECAPQEQLALLQALATRVDEVRAAWAKQQAPDPQPLDDAIQFYFSMRRWTIEGFVRSELGATRVLQYDPVPGVYEGCVPLASVGKAWAL